jgi:phosphohistidine phosphatase
VLCVYLIRHAPAFQRDRKRWPDDRERPLTPEGMKKFRQAAPGLESLVGTIECVLTSPLVRARQTAEILTSITGWPKALEAPELAPGRTPAQALALIRSQSVECLALVGHEPNLTDLLAVCIAGPGARVGCELKKGGVIALSFTATARAGQGQLNWLATPRTLRAIAKRSAR